MGTIVLILIILCIIFWPWISRWLRGFLARRSEDAIRKMMGMPTRKEEEKLRRKREEGYRRSSTHKEDDNLSRGEKIVRDMQEYAEDVDFIEIRDDDPQGK